MRLPVQGNIEGKGLYGSEVTASPTHRHFDKNVTSASAIGFAQWLKDSKGSRNKGRQDH